MTTVVAYCPWGFRADKDMRVHQIPCVIILVYLSTLWSGIPELSASAYCVESQLQVDD